MGGGLMTRFYIAYCVDAGQALAAHDVIEAENWHDAMKTWQQKVRGSIAYRRVPPDACFALPKRMADWSRDQVLSHYRDADFANQ